MVWSLSKDDDGLEPVHPLANQGRALSSPGDRLPSGAPHPSMRVPSTAPRPPHPGQHHSSAAQLPSNAAQHPSGAAQLLSGAAPSVFVEPSSQLPDARTRFPQREVVEPTMVLRGRQVDELRAEVARQKSTYRREKQRTLLLWAFAGGAALAVGWLAGMLLSPHHSSSLHSNTMLPHEADVAPAPMGQAQLAEPTPGPTPSDHPGEGEDARPDTDTAVPSDSDTFTLDDLPAE